LSAPTVESASKGSTATISNGHKPHGKTGSRTLLSQHPQQYQAKNAISNPSGTRIQNAPTESCAIV